MGKRNRQRRRDHHHHINRPARPPGPAGPPGPRGRRPLDARAVGEAFAELAQAITFGRPDVSQRVACALGAAWGEGPEVAEAASAALRSAASRAWEKGWQPCELVHVVGRKQGGPFRRLLLRVVVSDGANWRAHPDADPAWLQQLDDLEIARVGSADDCIVASWARAETMEPVDALLRAARLLTRLWTLERLPPTCDPPSAWGSPVSRQVGRGAASGAIDERMLARVRALLAKAESTEFAPEAEALTEKAQELMARYSIDHAVLASGDDRDNERPGSRRVLLHDPYAKGKSVLLARVARANRCKAVWDKERGFSTVFGFPTDLAVTDVLYTSLVSQCSSAMLAASKGVQNPRGFRSSFVFGFAARIGELSGRPLTPPSRMRRPPTEIHFFLCSRPETSWSSPPETKCSLISAPPRVVRSTGGATRPGRRRPSWRASRWADASRRDRGA